MARLAKKLSLKMLIVLALIAATFSACAQENSHARIIIYDGFDNVVLKNAEGKYLEYVYEQYEDKNDIEEIRGDMPYKKGVAETSDLYSEDDEGDDYNSYSYIEIPDSDYFSIEPRSKYWDVLEKPIHFKLKNRYNKNTSVYAEYVKKIEIDKGNVIITGVKKSTFDYNIITLMSNGKNDIYYRIGGDNIGSVKIEKEKKGVVLKGVKGIATISTHYKDAEFNISDGAYYMFGNAVKINVKNGKMIVNYALLIPERKTKCVTCLYLRSANEGKNMFLTWNKVQKAKSYVVYKYNSITEEYKRVAIINGNSSNYYNIPKADSTSVYKYKIAARSKKNGKGKNVCKTSYPVWAVAKNNTKANAVKVVTNKTKIKGKPDKKLRLKATALSSSDKPLLSDNIRWYCSNKKIATVGRDTGKVKLKKKGKCTIWAKAHNGKSSKAIVVTVK